jgi:hypothetical protein
MEAAGQLRLEIDAGRYKFAEVLSRFVPGLIWEQVRQTDRQQLLCGGVGTGKTILMKRLAWPAMLERPDFLETPFAAFYYDARDLEDLNCLYSESLGIQLATCGRCRTRTRTGYL